jgi:SAM-dependent methyltransferase
MSIPDTMLVFDRALVRRRRERAVAGGDRLDFLFAEVAARLTDRLADVKRGFAVGVDLGSRGGHLARAVAASRRVETLYAADPSPTLAARATVPAVAADEEALPFAPASLDLVISSLALHWVNDLPGALVQIRQALRPDGLFLGAMFGGETLWELRGVLTEAELAVTGGVSPRVSPMADLRDAAGLLQRAGFAIPVADRDTLTIAYPDALSLMRELGGMGEGNAIRMRATGPMRRAVLGEAVRLYETRHGFDGGRVRATFEVLYLSGWGPAATQQKPLRPGQAQHRLADALGAVERPAGDLATPNTSEIDVST